MKWLIKTGLIIINFVFLHSAVFSQTIPPIGTSQNLEIANWNIEWFGNTANGPTDENLQKKNVLNVLQHAQIDLWGLCEVSNAAAWDSLKANMPAYGGIISTWSQTQKTAFLYYKSTCNLLKSGNILAAYAKEFANGRTPLQATFVYTNNTQKDTFTAILLHLKANVGVDTAKLNAYNNRLASVGRLKSYLDTFGKNKKIIVLGDWNDDLDTSIYNQLQTPMQQILADTQHYFFPSFLLTRNNERSTVSYSSVIDHQCLNKSMQTVWLKDSCKIFKPDKWIVNYGSTTSDHYVVYSVYNFSKNTMNALHVQTEPFNVWFNGVAWQTNFENNETEFVVMDLNGREIWRGKYLHTFVYTIDYPLLFTRVFRGKVAWKFVQYVH